MQGSQNAHVPPILRLPPAVRHRIYPHIHPALGPLHFRLHLDRPNNRELLGFHSLLLSCRTIYDEISEVLYSTNVFEISFKSARSLRPMRNLRDANLSSLRELKVVLNEAPCHYEQCTQCCDRSGDDSLRDTSDCHAGAVRPCDDSAAALFAEWRLTAAYISSRITPQRLTVSLVCDFDPQDENTPSAARLTLAPLINLAPLKGCHVKLGRTPHPGLQEIARETVFRALGIVDHQEPALTSSTTAVGADSKLMCLPREIRFRILEYTDLITPFREVRWSRQHSGYIPTRDINCYVPDCPPQVHHGCQFGECWDYCEPPEFVDPRPHVGCFCRVRHAAFSFNCQCWSPPTDLFLVCRTLHQDAQAVFFTGNRFVVHDFKSETPWQTPGMPDYVYDRFAGMPHYPYDRFAVSEFLREVVPVDCLSLLRSLEVTFPPYNEEWPQDSSPALHDWVETVCFIKENMNLEGLTIRLTMYGAPVLDYAGAREHMTGSEAREVRQAYDRILGPMTGLGGEGLKRFYAEISLPEKFTSWFRDKDSTVEHFTGRLVKEERQLKQWAEQLVMGDRYPQQPEDACYWGGFTREPLDSVWRRIYLVIY